jgi:hypothetical protein
MKKEHDLTEKQERYIFLDDVRVPEDVYLYTGDNIYLGLPWKIVRNYNEFINDVLLNGVADGYSFDHDLADIHYDTKAHINVEKTGYHCAKWLIEYCMDENIKLPKTILIHSMNVQGSLNIKSLFNSYYKSLGLPSM